MSAKLKPPADMTSEELALALANAKNLETWIGAVREYALERALAGHMPEGYELTQGTKRRLWQPAEEPRIVAMLRQHGLKTQDMYELSSPSRVTEKLIAKGVMPAKTKPADRDRFYGDLLAPKETFQYLRPKKKGGTSAKGDFGGESHA